MGACFGKSNKPNSESNQKESRRSGGGCGNTHKQPMQYTAPPVPVAYVEQPIQQYERQSNYPTNIPASPEATPVKVVEVVQPQQAYNPYPQQQYAQQQYAQQQQYQQQQYAQQQLYMPPPRRTRRRRGGC
mmetsp:Transcript_1621/g.2475  ORF Transcript_1621/g.2475 Transcript_1621/m.2475 type:complete len:130 (-) Transcript_1621:1237-1626(-)